MAATMDVPQRFCVRWNSYKSNLQTAFPKLLTSEHFVDVTLACEKQYIKCHKIVLSACSAYFESLLVNNPCQHPIIFMKDVQFWEIKALVEFMYKGEVNVSQNQLDSLLKSAESLQIRGLSGNNSYVQFMNFKQNEESQDEKESIRDTKETKDSCKIKRNKSDNEDNEEEVIRKIKKKRVDDEEKCVQMSSAKEKEESMREKKSDDSNSEPAPLGQRSIKEETTDQEDFDFDNNYMEPNEEEEGEGFSQDVFYPDTSNDPGPSGISDLCSLALNNVECVMDQDKEKSCSSSPTNIHKNSTKPQQRHQEHNYTNPPVDDTSITITKVNVTNDGNPADEGDNHRVNKNSFKILTPSQFKVDLGEPAQRPIAIRQPSGTVGATERQPSEVKNRVIKKDVFNRIRRSEDELQKAAEMVRGGMTFQTASDTFNIPISTIRFYMARRGILPQRRRGRGSSGVRDDDLIHPPFEIIHYRLPDIDKPI